MDNTLLREQYAEERKNAMEYLKWCRYDTFRETIFLAPSPVTCREDQFLFSPYVEIGDIPVSVHFLMPNEKEPYTAPVYARVPMDSLQGLGVSEEQLIHDAFVNTSENNVLFTPVVPFLNKIVPHPGSSGYEESKDDLQLFIVSNKATILGGAVAFMPLVRESLYQRFGSYFILPSSIHESLIVPESGGYDFHELAAMVHDVNRTCVMPGETMGSCAFLYNGKDMSMLRFGDAQPHIIDKFEDLMTDHIKVMGKEINGNYEKIEEIQKPFRFGR